MANGPMRFALVQYSELTRDIQNMRNASETVIRQTIKDFKQRGPSWISAEVSKAYNIKKADIQPHASGRGGRRTAGNIRIRGDTVDSIKIEYRGRALTPVRFGMTPKVPREGSYTLKAQFVRGQKKTLGRKKKLTKKQRKNIGRNFTGQGTQNSSKSPIMLMHTGNRRVDGTNYIPFQRVSKDRGDIKPIKTVSVPQMITSARVSGKIQQSINENLGKRLEHHISRYM